MWIGKTARQLWNPHKDKSSRKSNEKQGGQTCGISILTIMQMMLLSKLGTQNANIVFQFSYMHGVIMNWIAFLNPCRMELQYLAHNYETHRWPRATASEGSGHHASGHHASQFVTQWCRFLQLDPPLEMIFEAFLWGPNLPKHLWEYFRHIKWPPAGCISWPGKAWQKFNFRSCSPAVQGRIWLGAERLRVVVQGATLFSPTKPSLCAQFRNIAAIYVYCIYI